MFLLSFRTQQATIMSRDFYLSISKCHLQLEQFRVKLILKWQCDLHIKWKGQQQVDSFFFFNLLNVWRI